MSDLRETFAHRVSRHLHLEATEYDDAIRQFIPGYEEMLRVAARPALAGSPRVVLDVGAGTGALSEVVLELSPSVQVVAYDADPDMLAVARARLAAWGGRVRFVQGSFLDPLPACDAAVSSLALHHTADLDQRSVVFRRVAEALSPGGVFVDADVTMPESPGSRSALYLAWADHLVSRGISPDRAWRHFVEWSGEDTYFPVAREMEAMAEAGFTPELEWRDRVVTVVVGKMPA